MPSQLKDDVRHTRSRFTLSRGDTVPASWSVLTMGNFIGGLIKLAVVVVLVIGGLFAFAYLSGDKAAQDAVKQITKDPIPVQVTLRGALLGDGQVARFISESPNKIVLAATFRRRASAEVSRRPIEIEANGEVEIGWAEGWAFMSGDEITLEHESFATKQLRVP